MLRHITLNDLPSVRRLLEVIWVKVLNAAVASGPAGGLYPPCTCRSGAGCGEQALYSDPVSKHQVRVLHRDVPAETKECAAAAGACKDVY